MKLGFRFKKVTVDGSEIQIRRTEHGVVEMRGRDDLDFARALGFAHAYDRMLQIMLLRVIGRGQICELLRDSEEAFAIDVYMRRMGFATDARADVARLSVDGLRFAEAYSSGVNHCLSTQGYPWEFKLLGYRPEPWSVADTLLTVQLMSYIGLAQNQEDVERLIIQALHAGVEPESLKNLFSPHLDEMTDEVVGLVKQSHLVHTLIPASLRFEPAIPTFSASNNWVLAPERSASGHVLQCNDPHLEFSRLPTIWYEFVMEIPSGFRMGISMPGVPGLVMGRTENVSMGFTYGFMDMVDFFIEECQSGEYRRSDSYHPFTEHGEVIRRKKHPPANVRRYENELGVLDTDPIQDGIADGYHLLRSWSGRNRSAQAVDNLFAVLRAETVMEAQTVLREMPISANWLIGDRRGNIGYQQSGVLPDRVHSGLHPLPAWREDNHWRGTVLPDRIASELNPEEGFLVTANGDHNQTGKPLSITMSMGPYREERIAQLLQSRRSHTLLDMRSLQADLYSGQAAAFMELLRPLIPDTEVGAVLRDWDLYYNQTSRGATLFEAVYEALLSEIIGPIFGDEVWGHLVGSTGILGVYYRVFDRALLKVTSPWFLGGAKRDVAQRVLVEVLAGFQPSSIPAWGAKQRVCMKHILFAGKLPHWLGFDYGPVSLRGGRATVEQANVFTSHNRATSVSPSYRYITDLGTNEIHTSLAGGPSDRRFSRWYTNEMASWLAQEYKVLRGHAADPGRE